MYSLLNLDDTKSSLFEFTGKEQWSRDVEPCPGSRRVCRTTRTRAPGSCCPDATSSLPRSPSASRHICALGGACAEDSDLRAGDQDELFREAVFTSREELRFRSSSGTSSQSCFSADFWGDPTGCQIGCLVQCSQLPLLLGRLRGWLLPGPYRAILVQKPSVALFVRGLVPVTGALSGCLPGLLRN